MAVKYVRSTTGSDSNGGTSWSDAYATIAKALSVGAAGDIAYVSQVHAETQATSITWNSPGTANNPYSIICCNDGATPPTAKASTATVSVTSSSNITLGSGYAIVYGITFQCGVGGAGNLQILVGAVTSLAGWILDTCTLKISTSGAGSRIQFGIGASGSEVAQFAVLIDTNIQFSAAGQSVTVGNVRLVWKGIGAVGGTTPTSLFLTIAGSSGRVDVDGIDLSPLGSGKNLVSLATTGTSEIDFYFTNCKLGASVSVITGTIINQGSARVFVDGCDSSTALYRMEHYKYQGSIKQETTHVRASGGASDGTTALSHNFTTLTSGPSLFSPLEGPWMSIWNSFNSSSHTVTVELCTENVVLTNADVYLEVEYLGSSSVPQATVNIASRTADIFSAASPTNLSTSGVSWSGFTTAKPQYIQVTFSPLMAGPMRARICVVKSNTTIYVDPLLTLA